MDKEQIKEELVDKSNGILQKYNEMDVIDTISVMNMAKKTVFLGSLKVYNYEVVPNIMRDLKGTEGLWRIGCKGPEGNAMLLSKLHPYQFQRFNFKLDIYEGIQAKVTL